MSTMSKLYGSSDGPLRIRPIQEADYAPITSVVDAWWGGRSMSAMLPKLFFVHFCSTSFVAEDESRRLGFLIGFLSQTHREQAYVHFIGVNPSCRKLGLGSLLYEHFFRTVAGEGRTMVSAVTALTNLDSLQFHARIGFAVDTQSLANEGRALLTKRIAVA